MRGDNEGSELGSSGGGGRGGAERRKKNAGEAVLAGIVP